jgi:hypothetical protein
VALVPEFQGLSLGNGVIYAESTDLQFLVGRGHGFAPTADRSIIQRCHHAADHDFLAYIMIEVGMEFDIDKSRLSSYAVDYGIAMAAAAVPWLCAAIYFY